MSLFGWHFVCQHTQRNTTSSHYACRCSDRFFSVGWLFCAFSQIRVGLWTRLVLGLMWVLPFCVIVHCYVVELMASVHGLDSIVDPYHPIGQHSIATSFGHIANCNTVYTASYSELDEERGSYVYAQGLGTCVRCFTYSPQLSCRCWSIAFFLHFVFHICSPRIFNL